MGYEESASGLSRRGFMGVFGALATGVGAGSTRGAAHPDAREREETGRLSAAYHLRSRVAADQLDGPLPDYDVSPDRGSYDTNIAVYSKGLPHDDRGEVDSEAYQTLERALETGDPDDFEAIPLGVGTRHLKEPQGAFGYELVGPDPHDTEVPPPPAFDSEEAAAEMAELYWRAESMDVPFAAYGEHDRIAEAATDLQQFSGRDPSPHTVFTDVLGDRPGPRVSQFLCQSYARGALQVDQRYRVGEPGRFYMTEYDEWLAIQRGAGPSVDQSFDETERYVRNGRDLAEVTHEDVPIQHFNNAVVYLLGDEAPINPALSFEGAILDSSIPYDEDDPLVPFINFGFFDAVDAVVGCLDCAASAAWFHKWQLHRRLRPEAYGGRVHNHLANDVEYPLPEQLFESAVLDRIEERHGSYLLPQVYPEGAPLHPSYPSGHAAIAGACATVIKAYFDESYVFEAPARASADGTELVHDVDQELTLGDEVDKLAANIADGRCWGMVHYPSDATAGLRLGEAVGISLLRGRKQTSNLADRFDGWQLTTFDGETITI